MESKIIRPEPNKPITALVVESRAVESKFGGEQVLVTLEGGKLLYMPAAAARVISAGHAYTICKKQIREGMKATWKVEPAEPEAPPVRGRPGDPRLRTDAAYDDGPYSAPEPPLSPLERKLQASIDAVNRHKAEIAAASANAANAAPAPSRLTAALCAAVDAAAAATKHAKEKYGIDLTFNEEQIKCLGVTAYIQNARSTQ